MVWSALKGLSNLRVTTIPRVELLTPPILHYLRKALAGQSPGLDLFPIGQMAKSAEDLQLSRANWTQILTKVRTWSHQDPQYGRYYQRYFFDEHFVDDTLKLALRRVPENWVIGVVDANGGKSQQVAAANP